LAGRAQHGLREILGLHAAKQSSAPAVEDGMVHAMLQNPCASLQPQNKCLLKQQPVLAQNSAQVSP